MRVYVFTISSNTFHPVSYCDASRSACVRRGPQHTGRGAGSVTIRTTRRGGISASLAQPSTAWPSLAQLGPAWPSLAQPGTAWHTLAQPGSTDLRRRVSWTAKRGPRGFPLNRASSAARV